MSVTPFRAVNRYLDLSLASAEVRATTRYQKYLSMKCDGQNKVMETIKNIFGATIILLVGYVMVYLFLLVTAPK